MIIFLIGLMAGGLEGVITICRYIVSERESEIPVRFTAG